MKSVLVTGGTVFVSRYVAEYYAKKGWNVFVLNRNNREQSQGVTLIESDRHALDDKLRGYHFDLVIDTAYTSNDVNTLLDALGSFHDYVLISSSAVYPEYSKQPFTEDTQLGVNKFWGKYGTDKICAEHALKSRCPDAYILRPPYLYGPMNNIYREAFVFDCALNNRPFYLPKDGDMKLQFYHVNDLCVFIDTLLLLKPRQHIFNVGNKDTVSVREWADICYNVAGKSVRFINVYENVEQKNYFSFHDYEYYLDVSRQYELLPGVKPLLDGLQEAFNWYIANRDKVNRKPLAEYIDRNFN